jgi:uncharacterized protein (TIRG00374 family)
MTEDSESARPADVAGGPEMSGWGYRAVTWSVALAALGYLAFSLWGGWGDVAAAAGKVGLAGLAAALSLSLVNYGLRFARWQAYLAAMGHAVPWQQSLRIYLTGFALTTTPGKAGETIRGVLLRKRSVPYPVSFAAFFSERLSDLLAVVLLALLGLSSYAPARPLVAIGAILVFVGMVMLTNQGFANWLEGRVSGTSRRHMLLRHVRAVLQQARRCHAPTLLAGATVLSIVAWAAEAWAFYLILGWMSVPIPPTMAIFVYALSMLGGALSFMPGGLGGAEAIMIGLLLWQGAGAADAVAATVIIRVATLWFAVLLGIGAATFRVHG